MDTAHYDWTHRLDWDDIIGVDTADHGKSIDEINIEMTLLLTGSKVNRSRH
jgi:hypothetical protein